MSCRPPCGGIKLIGAGGSLKVPTVVTRIEAVENELVVSNTDGTSYTVALPKAAPANVKEVTVLNASGTRTVAYVATITEE